MKQTTNAIEFFNSLQKVISKIIRQVLESLKKASLKVKIFKDR